MSTRFPAGTVRISQETAEIVAVSLEGEFDLATTPAILEAAQHVLDHDEHLILDLNGASFIDSSVVNVVLRIHKDATPRGRVAVLELASDAIVERTLEISGICQVVPRVRTRADAVRTIRRATAPVAGGDVARGVPERP